MRPRFVLPPDSEATVPPEQRGLDRDGVRLLVARPAGVAHRRFGDLPGELEPGDLLVVNVSPTAPAALSATWAGGGPVVVHVAGPGPGGTWVVEPRRPDGTGPAAAEGRRIDLPGGVLLELCEPYSPGRLWTARATPRVALRDYLSAYGRPVSYGYLAAPRPLADYQTVYADDAGSNGWASNGWASNEMPSAEMASAGRPVTARLLARLVPRGVPVAPVVLHAGLSSPEKHEPPAAERYRVPVATARLVNVTRAAGGRVVAVGTTVVRALETVASDDGEVRPGQGWSDLVLGPDRPARAVTGLVTGLHEPAASHLHLLDAVAGPQLVDAAYREAVRERYLWHEFGDSMLLLP